jgi:hypothetical protein
MFGVVRDQMVLPAKPTNVVSLWNLRTPLPSSKAVIIFVSIETEIESRDSIEPEKIYRIRLGRRLKPKSTVAPQHWLHQLKVEWPAWRVAGALRSRLARVPVDRGTLQSLIGR